MQTNTTCFNPQYMAVALGRWCLGVILLVAGVGKLSRGLGGFAGVLLPMYSQTWLPAPLLNLFAHALPFSETILGALLLLGLVRNIALSLAGLQFLVLTFGQIVLAMSGKPESAAVTFQNMVYTFFAAGLLFLAAYDRWTLPCRCGAGPRTAEAGDPAGGRN